MCEQCPAGKYQPENGKAYCLPCLPGAYGGALGMRQCHLCEPGKFSKNAGELECQNCSLGESSSEGSAECTACGAGTYGKIKGGCEPCEPGFYRNSTDSQTNSCRACPKGTYQSYSGGASCFPCVPGEFGNETRLSICHKCRIGRVSRRSQSLICSDCDIGQSSDTEGGTKCTPCGAGMYGEVKGKACTLCQTGRYRNSTDTVTNTCRACPAGFNQNSFGQASCLPCLPGEFGNETGMSFCHKCVIGKVSKAPESKKCSECKAGESAETAGMSQCTPCDVGRFQNISIEHSRCELCSGGLYQDSKAKTSCKKCAGGKIANVQGTACENPSYKIASDCDYMTQYLHDVDPDPETHYCAPCPLGALCMGDINWSGVRAKKGWWRNQIAEDRRAPPKCLEEQQSLTEPKCAFSRCTFPAACIGEQTISNATNRTRNCDTNSGYKEAGCFDHTARNASTTMRCRLCGTCRQGYKRAGQGTRCKQCPPPSTNRALLFVGFLCCAIVLCVIIYTAVRSETNGQGSSRSAIKKILVSESTWPILPVMLNILIRKKFSHPPSTSHPSCDSLPPAQLLRHGQPRRKPSSSLATRAGKHV